MPGVSSRSPPSTDEFCRLPTSESWTTDEGGVMGQVRFGISVSLDGFAAGPEQSLENPLGIGGEDLHDWIVRLDVWRRAHGEEGGDTTPSSAVVEESVANVGAYVMGRNMF